MSGPQPQERLILDLAGLPGETELSRPVAEALALAASVVLDRLHALREWDAALIQQRGTASRPAELRRAAVDDAARRTYADPQEATEEGAEAVGILVARRVFDRIVCRRLPKGTGADYRMRDPLRPDGDDYERLECSGIADGPETAAARLRKKVDQLARVPLLPAGYAVVTSFRPEPVDIQCGSFGK